MVLWRVLKRGHLEMEQQMQFNGLSLAVVERRCRPCEDKSDPDWKCMSSTGFLAADESFLAVLARDQRALARLGVSCGHLAQRLRALMERLSGEEGALSDEAGQVRYTRTWFVSPQYSPFFNDKRGDGRHEAGWSEEWKVRRGEVSLVLTRGALDMAECFGFFEGGLDGSNRYRIDPDTAVCLLEGRVAPEAMEYRQLRRRHKNRERAREKERLVAEMAGKMHKPGAREFLEEQLRRLADK